MEVTVCQVGKDKNEIVEIYCHEVTEEVNDIVRFVKTRQGQLSGTMDEKQYEISILDILYIEAIDNRCFIYTTNSVYETREKLYNLENALTEKNFLRISKSTIVNLMKITAIKPALNSRLLAVMKNGEEIIISRKYVSDLKKKLKGEALDER